jgi:hypothetical protein
LIHTDGCTLTIRGRERVRQPWDQSTAIGPQTRRHQLLDTSALIQGLFTRTLADVLVRRRVGVAFRVRKGAEKGQDELLATGGGIRTLVNLLGNGGQLVVYGCNGGTGARNDVVFVVPSTDFSFAGLVRDTHCKKYCSGGILFGFGVVSNKTRVV